ncbi:MAG: nucleotidyltransferase family protein [Gemmatimonadaceae bacterium]
MISAIVLAAGLARRFGSAKTLALYRAKPLVRHVVDCLALPDIHETIVVIPGLAEYAAPLAQSGARLVMNERASDGMSSSLLVGLGSIDPRTQAILVALADQPTIAREVVLALIREWHTTRAHIVAPLYRGERGHPVLFDAAAFPELRMITGDRGARDVVDRDPSRVRLVALDREAPRDVDIPLDLESLP